MTLQKEEGVVIIGAMPLKWTPLYKVHKELGARMITFAGWEMPVQYTSIIEEHMAVREAVGLFDVSHMGRIEVYGKGALEALQYLTTNDVKRLSPGMVQYTLLCNEKGGVIDDILLYMMEGERFLLCVNAVNREKDLKWIEGRLGKGVVVEDKSFSLAQIALQGPKAEELLTGFCKEDLSSIGYYRFKMVEIDGTPSLLSRTGYTGEEGFEVYLPQDRVCKLWKGLMEAGRGLGIKPCGLGARDTLRTEMGYCLYGHELDESTTPLEAGLTRFVRLEKGDFVGRDALTEQKKVGVKKRLIGFRMIEKGIPRKGYPIVSSGKEIGRVTSGIFSPVLKRAIGMGYVESEYASMDSKVGILIRGNERRAMVVKPPFIETRHTP